MKIWEDLLQDIEKNIPSGTECELKMMHSKSALTRFANSQIHQNVDEESADVFLTLHNDSKTITISTNLTALKNPKDFVSRAMDSLNNSPIDKGWAGLPDSSESFNGLSNIDESTPDERANKVKDFVSEGKKMNAAGYCSSYINNYFVWNTNGLNSSDSSSSAFIDGIFRTESSAGSSHRGGILLSDIEMNGLISGSPAPCTGIVIELLDRSFVSSVMVAFANPSWVGVYETSRVALESGLILK
mgnify:CR=1 FL=1